MRPAKPTALKVIQGTYRKDRAKNEPQFSSVRKSIPATISPGAKPYWKELAGLLEGARILTDGDRRVLELACEALAQHRSATLALTSFGLTYTTEGDSGTVVRARPEVAIADAAARRAHRILADFGLTPGSRSRISVAPAPEKNPFDEFD
jgi:P27 family predicted phage terminase small subunit